MAPGPAWSNHVRTVLSNAGLRHGEARERVIELLAGESCALSAVEIEDTLRASGRPTGRASIYRVLELLAENDLVERVEVGDGVSRFEPIHPGGEHHHHLVCDRCGRLVAFDDPGLERAIGRLSDRLGMQINHHEVVLRGSCEACG